MLEFQDPLFHFHTRNNYFIIANFGQMVMSVFHPRLGLKIYEIFTFSQNWAFCHQISDRCGSILNPESTPCDFMNWNFQFRMASTANQLSKHQKWLKHCQFCRFCDKVCCTYSKCYEITQNLHLKHCPAKQQTKSTPSRNASFSLHSIFFFIFYNYWQ